MIFIGPWRKVFLISLIDRFLKDRVCHQMTVYAKLLWIFYKINLSCYIKHYQAPVAFCGHVTSHIVFHLCAAYPSVFQINPTHPNPHPYISLTQGPFHDHISKISQYPKENVKGDLQADEILIQDVLPVDVE